MYISHPSDTHWSHFDLLKLFILNNQLWTVGPVVLKTNKSHQIAAAPNDGNCPGHQLQWCRREGFDQWGTCRLGINPWLWRFLVRHSVIFWGSGAEQFWFLSHEMTLKHRFGTFIGQLCNCPQHIDLCSWSLFPRTHPSERITCEMPCYVELA